MIASCRIVLAQQKAEFVTLHWLVYTKYLLDMLAYHQLYVLMSCETAIHTRHCHNDYKSFHWPNCLVQIPCEINSESNHLLCLDSVIDLNCYNIWVNEYWTLPVCFYWQLYTSIKILKDYYFHLLYSVNTLVVKKIHHDS